MRKAEIRLRNRFFIPAYWLLAAVLACIVTLSLSFWQYGTAEGFAGAPWRSLMQIAWRTAAYALLGSGQLKGYRNGRSWRIPKEAVRRFILERAGLH